ncbi:MAG: spore coat protein CotH, partial [Pedosphaera sp.]|nr:spore coat protein CotH [Pedosphaera sp.]
PDGVSSVRLWYASEGGAWSSVTMSNVSGTAYAAILPGQAAGTLVQFYVEGRDGFNAGSFFPAGGTNSRALYRVNDGQAIAGPTRNFRILMTQADATLLHATTNVLSNESLGATVLNDEQEIFYDVGVRLKGSFVGRNVPRVGFTVDFDPTQLFRGIHEAVSLDRSQGASIGQGEILVKHIASHAGGIPNMYDDLVHVITPRAQDTSMAQLRMAAFGDVYLDSQYHNGSSGPMYESEVLRYSSTTADGTTEGLKVPGAGLVNVDLADYGTNTETYRWSLLQSNNRSGEDYSRIIAMSQTFSLTGTTLDARTKPLMDINEWMRTWAFESLIGVSDGYFTGNSPHNFRMYVRPDDQKVLAMPWDWDSCFVKSATANLVGTGNLAKIVNLPGNLHTYYGHLNDMINTTFNTAYMTRWTQHYGVLAGQDFSGILTYIGQRASFVQGQLPTGIPFAITSNLGNDFGTNNTQVVLSGTGPIQVGSIQVNGVDYAVNWTSITNWNLTLPLSAGTNSLTVRGFDLNGVPVANATDTIIITNNGVGAPQPVVVNEWMADNAAPGGIADPVDGLFKDWFELYNPNATPIDLSGCYLTDTLSQPTQWQIPTNRVIAGNGFLLVWADNLTNLNGMGANGDLHANFQLSKGGEAIGLFAPDGVRPLSTVTFGAQEQNVSQGRFRDGNTNGIFPMVTFTPRQANFLPAPRFSQLSLSPGLATLVWEAVPGVNYQLQYKTNLADGSWTDLSPGVLATNSSVSFTNAINGDPQRFYRLLRTN